MDLVFPLRLKAGSLAEYELDLTATPSLPAIHCERFFAKIVRLERNVRRRFMVGQDFITTINNLRGYSRILKNRNETHKQCALRLLSKFSIQQLQRLGNAAYAQLLRVVRITFAFETVEEAILVFALYLLWILQSNPDPRTKTAIAKAKAV